MADLLKLKEKIKVGLTGVGSLEKYLQEAMAQKYEMNIVMTTAISLKGVVVGLEKLHDKSIFHLKLLDPTKVKAGRILRVQEKLVSYIERLT